MVFDAALVFKCAVFLRYVLHKWSIKIQMQIAHALIMSARACIHSNPHQITRVFMGGGRFGASGHGGAMKRIREEKM